MQTPNVHPAPPGTRRLLARHVPELPGTVSLALLLDGWTVEVITRGRVALRSGGHTSAQDAVSLAASALDARGPWCDALARLAEPPPLAA